MPHSVFSGFEQCTVREEDGKLISETGKFTSVREIQGEEMIEVSCCKTALKDKRFNVREISM